MSSTICPSLSQKRGGACEQHVEVQLRHLHVERWGKITCTQVLRSCPNRFGNRLGAGLRQMSGISLPVGADPG